MTHDTKKKARDRQMAGITLQFLAKTKLDGVEVQAYVAVNNWLNEMLIDDTPKAPVYRQHDNMVSDEEADDLG